MLDIVQKVLKVKVGGGDLPVDALLQDIHRESIAGGTHHPRVSLTGLGEEVEYLELLIMPQCSNVFQAPSDEHQTQLWAEQQQHQ